MSLQAIGVALLTLLAASHFLRGALRELRPAHRATGKPCGGCSSGGCSGLATPAKRP